MLGLVLVVAVVVLIVTDPFGGSTKSGGGVGDNATATSLATVTRRSLSSQTQVSGTLGYAGSSSIRVPSGTAPSAVSQAEQSVTNARRNAADSQSVAGGRQRSARGSPGDRVGCPREGGGRLRWRWRRGKRVQRLPLGRRRLGSVRERRAGGLDRRAGLHRRCDEGQKLTERRSPRPKSSSRALNRVCPRRAQRPRSTVRARRSRSCHRWARSSRVGRASMRSAVSRCCCCMARCCRRERSSRGCQRDRTSRELNANLDALGYGQGLTGDTFSAATAAAIRAFQSAHGLTVTGELLLGSVVFEPGAVRVTSVTPTVGATVMPGPVLGDQLDRSPGQGRARRGPAGKCQEGRPGHDHPARQPDHAGADHVCLERRHIAVEQTPVKKKARRPSKSTPHRRIPRRLATSTRRP